MPSENFHQLTIAQFAEMVERYPFQRQINEVHMHHTYIPARVDYRGLETIVGMWKYHTTPAPKGRGWSDIAQHVTIAPNGTIWTGRPWNRPPASAYGFNGSSSLGPFMFETIGNFDIGHDRLEGAQLDSVIAVIALIQLHAGIAADKLRFHNEMTNEKTCPGTGVKHTDILGLVARYHKAQAKPRDLASPPLRMPDDRLVTRALLEQFSRDGSTRAAGTMEDELPEGGMTFAQRQGAYEALDTSDHTRGGARDAARAGLTPEEIAALAPHVINLNQGELSRGGAVQTSVADVARIFDEHIPQFLAALIAADQAPNLRIMFFAHGGLVGEMSGLAVAHKGVEWWKKNGVYPIYFVWETGLCETLGQIFDKVLRLTGVRRGDRGILDGIASVGSAIGDKLVDHVTDNLIAEIAHDVGGVSVWGEMKSNARHANQPLGGASVVVSNLQRFLKTPPAGANITLHAVGHSAGAIFHSYFVPLVHAETGRTFQTVDFLAPAVRVDEFKQTLWPMVRPVAAAAKPAAADAKAVAADRLTIYTMHDALERADNCGPYRKSLLYLIHDGLEPNRDEPILGLERSMNEDDDLAKDLVNTATRKRNAEIIWSVSPGSTSKSHGGFDDDPATMNNVLARILALSNQQLQSEFKESTEADDPFVVKFKRCLDDLGKTRDLDVFEFRPAPPPLPCGCDGHGAPPASAVAAHHAASAHGGGASHARRALCIGIDRYPVSPLGGCVADARTWSAALSSAGFETSLLLDGDATRSRILTAIERLISGSGSGDVLVLQYSGHGTTLPDRNADETEDPNDQAVCPVDFPQGHFLVDDDIAKLFERIPHGVNLTCFFDCCHSGSITRFAIGAAPVPRGAGTRRARFVRATPEMIQAHESFRARNGPEAPRGAAMVSRGPATMREVVYSACRRDEVAYENDGQGDFTRLAVPLLQRAGASLTNLQFRELVKKAFGENPAQHPLLDCAPRSENLAFLSSAMSGASPSREFSVSPSARSAPSGGGDARTDAVARLLRDVANLLDT